MPERPGSRPARDGLVVVDKPAGWTSHDVVARVRRLARTRRVGHAGTLDPMATGVLVLGVGAGTRLLHHLVLTDKDYAATMRLGAATLTDDAEGEVLTTRSAAGVMSDDVAAAMTAFTGEIDQVPSAISAVKVDGQRAYHRVRQGEQVELAARRVTVSRFALVGSRRADPELLDVDVEVSCSSGTYVRALARDVGAALGVGGHLTALRRTRVGPFTLEHAASLEALSGRDDPVALPLAAAVAAAMPVRSVSEDEVRELSFGRALAATGFAGVHGALDPGGEVVALLRDDGGQARPVAVFRPAG